MAIFMLQDAGGDASAGANLCRDSALSGNWENVSATDTAQQPHEFEPVAPPGPNIGDLDAASEAINYLKLFFTEDIVQGLVDETNAYAHRKLQQPNLKPQYRLRAYTDTSVEEMYHFFGVILNMGIIHAPEIQAYWRSDWISNIPFFHNAFDRNRFLRLYHTAIHECHDNPEERHGHKIQPIVEAMCISFQQYFVPYQDVSGDESMIGYKGRCSCKQYNPKKNNKMVNSHAHPG